jgi:cyclophilin family peptidyl-prolyl cis-trans isomerase
MAAAAATTQPAQNPVVLIETSMGNIKVELFADKAPITVKNFLAYADEKFYDNTIFHRIIGKENSGKDFMIQCGGFDTKLKKKETKDNIKNEANNGLSNLRGTLAMARLGDPEFDSASSQFFINVVDNKFLDYAGPQAFGYCVFGRVTEGMDVVDKIKAAPTENRGGAFTNIPKEEISIKKVTRVEKK